MIICACALVLGVLTVAQPARACTMIASTVVIEAPEAENDAEPPEENDDDDETQPTQEVEDLAERMGGMRLL